MRAGNFSDPELRKIEGLVGGRYVTQSGNPASRLRADQFPGGIIPPSQIDPTGKRLMNLYPRPMSIRTPAADSITSSRSFSIRTVFSG